MAGKRKRSLSEKIINLKGHAAPPVKRLMRYTLSGGTSTLLDFILLWIFTDILGLYYLLSGALSFIISISFNYNINHFWGFRETRREFSQGYSMFFIFGVIGLVLTLALLAFFVEIINLHYIIARALAAIFVGLWNYVMNIKFTFKSTVFGKH